MLHEGIAARCTLQYLQITVNGIILCAIPVPLGNPSIYWISVHSPQMIVQLMTLCANVLREINSTGF